MPSLCRTNQGHLHKHVNIFIANKICKLHCFSCLYDFYLLGCIPWKLSCDFISFWICSTSVNSLPFLPVILHFNYLWWLAGRKAELFMFLISISKWLIDCQYHGHHQSLYQAVGEQYIYLVIHSMLGILESYHHYYNSKCKPKVPSLL